MKKTKTPRAARNRRHARVRKKVSGTETRPRLCVYRSSSHIYAQVIDDVSRRTLIAASDMEAGLKSQAEGKKKVEVASLVGDLVADRAKDQGITQVVFDRGGYPFHGRVKALAEAVRSGGVSF